mgnify:CR=1 FL=1
MLKADTADALQHQPRATCINSVSRAQPRDLAANRHRLGEYTVSPLVSSESVEIPPPRPSPSDRDTRREKGPAIGPFSRNLATTRPIRAYSLVTVTPESFST